MSDKATRLKLCALASLMVAALGCVGQTEDEPQGARLQAPGVRTGGVLRIAGRTDVDSMDPGSMYSPVAWRLARGVFRTLLTYPAVSDLAGQKEVVPDLAEDTGTANDDNTEWTFELKEDVEYGPALGGDRVSGVTGEEIVCDDFKYAFERLFRGSVRAGYPFYYDILEGVDDFRQGRAEGISGVGCEDDKTIKFRLTQPAGDWRYRMTLPAASPVPRAAGARHDDKDVSDYANYAVATGPYLVQKWRPNKLIHLVRNPHWRRETDDVRGAYVDEVDWRMGLDNDLAIHQVLKGGFSYGMDLYPSGPQLAHIVSHPALRKSLLSARTLCARYVFMNTDIPPFDKRKVREAVNLAIDRANLQRMEGGPALAEVATSVLPPLVQGHLPPVQYNPFGTPAMAGDPAKAKQLMAEAGYPNGYDGRVVLVGAAGSPYREQFHSIREDLEQMGFSNIESKLPAVPSYPERTAKVGIGTAAGWCGDYNDASTYMRPLFHGGSLGETKNYNYARFNDPALNRLIDEATALSVGRERSAKWEQANRMATELGAWVPLFWGKTVILHNGRLANVVYNSFLSHIDWVAVGVRGANSG